MPVLKIIKGYRFFFYSNEHDPMHIHVEKDKKTAKLNLLPVEVVKVKGFKANEQKEIRKLVEENVELFKKQWNEYFNKE